MREKKDLRLFFALWPDDEVREKISQTLKAFAANSGRVIPRYNWHMTLHFIGNTSFSEKNCLHRQALKLKSKAFDLIIDQSGYFKIPRVFWLGCREKPEALLDLQRNLGKEISRCDYQPEARPYSPHITVTRKLGQAPEPEPVKPVEWRVDRFVLVESVSIPNGVRYEVLESYELNPAGGRY